MPFPRNSFNPTDLSEQQRNLKTLERQLQSALMQVQLRLESPDQPGKVFSEMQSFTQFWMELKANGRY